MPLVASFEGHDLVDSEDDYTSNWSSSLHLSIPLIRYEIYQSWVLSFNEKKKLEHKETGSLKLVLSLKDT